MNKYKVIEVEWIDAQSSLDSMTVSDLVKQDILLTRSVGYLMFEDENKVILSFMNFGINIFEEPIMKHYQIIPKGMVKNINVIRDIDEEDMFVKASDFDDNNKEEKTYPPEGQKHYSKSTNNRRHFLCNPHLDNDKKMTLNWKLVTCNNCLRKKDTLRKTVNKVKNTNEIICCIDGCGKVWEGIAFKKYYCKKHYNEKIWNKKSSNRDKLEDEDYLEDDSNYEKE